MRRLALITAGLLMLGITRLAAESQPAFTSLSVRVEQVPVHYIEPVFRAYVTAGANKFTFLIPSAFHLGGDPEKGHLALNNASGNCLVGFRILSPLESTNQLGMEWCRELAVKKQANSKLIGESAATPATRGPAFDLEWKNESGYTQKTRVIYVASPAGVLEFTVTAGEKQFSEAQYTLRSLIHSFVSSVNGKLPIEQVSGNT